MFCFGIFFFSLSALRPSDWLYALHLPSAILLFFMLRMCVYHV